jgi:hypothetical protein
LNFEGWRVLVALLLLLSHRIASPGLDGEWARHWHNALPTLLVFEFRMQISEFIRVVAFFEQALSLLRELTHLCFAGVN